MPLFLSLKEEYEHAYRCSYVDEERAELSSSDCLHFPYEVGSMVIP